MSNVIAVIILILVIGAAVAYIVRAKKKGAKCIGCPASGNCAMKNQKQPRQPEQNCGCHSEK